MRRLNEFLLPISPDGKATSKTFRAMLRNAVILPLLLTLSLTGFFYWQVTELLELNDWVERTDRTVAQAYDTQRLFSESQNGMRGYLLTGDPRFLEPYNDAASKISNSLALLRNSLEDGDERGHLQRVEKLHQQWSVFSVAQIAARREGREYLPRLLEGRRIMNSIRTELGRFVAQEQALRDLRSARARTAAMNLIVSTVLLAILLGIALALFARRSIINLAGEYTRALQQTRQKAQELNASRIALHESEEQLKSLINSAMDAIISFSAADHSIRIFNQAAERMFGCAAADALGQRVEKFMPSIPLSRPVEAAKSAEASGSQRVMLAVRNNGERFPVEATLSRTAAGGDNLLALIIRDVSDRVKAEAERARLLQREKTARAAAENAEREALHANRAKDEFLATLSHELRTPLTAILGWVRLIRSGKLPYEKMEHGLDVIEKSTKIQADLIEDLLDVSRIVTGKLNLNLRQIMLSPVINASLEAVRPSAEAKGIRLRSMIVSSNRRVLGDPSRLQQVIWNLLSNAVKFTPRGGSIEVRMSEVNDHIEIQVSDTGQGIAREFLPYVFDRFRQADSSSTRAKGGLGIGLAIVRYLVEAHGGTITAESKGVGQGATFTVSLPVAHTLSPRPERLTPVNANTEGQFGNSTLEGLHILVVEDEPDSLDVIRMVLEQRGARVTPATSVDEALMLIEKAHPDVLISDIAMPQRDGYDLIRELRTRGETLPAAALTAFAKEEDREQALSAGFQAHMPKPVEPSELASVVADLASRYR
ncbi:MAG TPA: ATP-binding protein [Planctomycetota bacterium]|nr:ATP-binding protein [Planctomycetota bacterium]